MSIADKLQTIAENEQKVYDAGYGKGYEQGVTDEYESYWNPMWRVRKDNNFNNAFTGYGWNDKTFKPPKNTKIYPSSSANMFSRCQITNLESLLAERNAEIDTKGSYYVDEFCSQSSITHVPVINATTSYGCNSMFNACSNLVSVRKIILKDTGAQSLTNAFSGCSKLEHIRFEGVIGTNVSFSACNKLTHESLFGEIATEEQKTAGKNILLFNGQHYYGGIIIALRDFVSEGSTTTRTLTLGSTNLAKLTDEEKAIATQRGWTLA